LTEGSDGAYVNVPEEAHSKKLLREAPGSIHGESSHHPSMKFSFAVRQHTLFINGSFSESLFRRQDHSEIASLNLGKNKRFPSAVLHSHRDALFKIFTLGSLPAAMILEVALVMVVMSSTLMIVIVTMVIITLVVITLVVITLVVITLVVITTPMSPIDSLKLCIRQLDFVNETHGLHDWILYRNVTHVNISFLLLIYQLLYGVQNIEH
jgi:hypothetical protein